MKEIKALEIKRRSIVKSLLWRLIGIVWTWIGAYLIILLIPEKLKTAAWIATLIVIYHHSTRLLMYYGYERIWATIQWGRIDNNTNLLPLSFRDKVLWASATLLSVSFLFFLLIYVSPIIKK